MLVLRTERLHLRWFHPDDSDFILELTGDADWRANISDSGPRTTDDARAYITSRLVDHYLERGHGLWAMVRRDDDALIGMCGLVGRPSLPSIDVGYALVPRHRNQGYAREAAAACLSYARDVLGRERVLAITSPENHASARVLEAIGMRFEETLVLQGEARESSVFRWESGVTPPVGDREAIDDLARRFFSTFDNRDGAIAVVAAIPSLFTRDAVVRKAPAGPAESVWQFLEPRAALLTSGRLRDFTEAEVESRTEVSDAIAQRWCRYEKSGVLDGVPFRGSGVKLLQLVKVAAGWRIVSLVWQDLDA